MIDRKTQDRVLDFFENLGKSAVAWIDEGYKVHVEQHTTGHVIDPGPNEDYVVDGFVVTIYGGRPAAERTESFGISHTAE